MGQDLTLFKVGEQRALERVQQGRRGPMQSSAWEGGGELQEDVLGERNRPDRAAGRWEGVRRPRTETVWAGR